MFPTCDRSDRKLRRTIPPILRGSISPKRDESYQLSRRRGRYDGRTYLRKSLREFEGRLLELENQGKVESQMKRLKPFWNQGYFQCGVVWDRPGFATLIGNDNTNHTVDDANDADDDDGFGTECTSNFWRILSAACFSTDIRRVEFINVRNISNWPCFTQPDRARHSCACELHHGK